MRVTIKEILFGMVKLVLFITVVSLIIYPFSKGIPFLLFLDTDDVKEVHISQTENDSEIILTDKTDVYNAVQLKSFVSYKVGSGEKTQQQGSVKITYYKTDGSVKTYSADNENLYYNGKVYELKNKDLFITVTNKMFLQ